MAILSYSWRYDIAKCKIFSRWHHDTCCKDFLLTQVENPAIWRGLSVVTTLQIAGVHTLTALFEFSSHRTWNSHRTPQCDQMWLYMHVPRFGLGIQMMASFSNEKKDGQLCLNALPRSSLSSHTLSILIISLPRLSTPPPVCLFPPPPTPSPPPPPPPPPHCKFRKTTAQLQTSSLTL